ncbi:unnamed protein product, partial [Ectocarpus sp. 12 AP-2014]
MFVSERRWIKVVAHVIRVSGTWTAGPRMQQQPAAPQVPPPSDGVIPSPPPPPVRRASRPSWPLPPRCSGWSSSSRCGSRSAVGAGALPPHPPAAAAGGISEEAKRKSSPERTPSWGGLRKTLDRTLRAGAGFRRRRGYRRVRATAALIPARAAATATTARCCERGRRRRIWVGAGRSIARAPGEEQEEYARREGGVGDLFAAPRGLGAVHGSRRRRTQSGVAGDAGR